MWTTIIFVEKNVRISCSVKDSHFFQQQKNNSVLVRVGLDSEKRIVSEKRRKDAKKSVKFKTRGKDSKRGY